MSTPATTEVAAAVAVPVRADVTTNISEGPASKAAKAVAALLALVTAVTAVLHGDHTPETLAAGAGAVLVLVTYLAGRYAQAVAIVRDSPSPAAAIRELAALPDVDELAKAVAERLEERAEAKLDRASLRAAAAASSAPPSWSTPATAAARALADDEVDELGHDDEPPGAEDATPLEKPPMPDESDGDAADATEEGPRA